MAAGDLFKKNSGKSSTKLRGKLPSKTSINLVLIKKNKINMKLAVLAIILILGVAYLFSKYLVYDRIMAVSEANARVSRLQNTLESDMTALDSFSGVEETYAHYTLDGMTEEELGLVDRTLVLDLVSTVLSGALVKETVTWTLSANTLTIELAGKSLSSLNQLARKIEENPIVDSCSITTANKSNNSEIAGDVKGRFVIYLHNPPTDGTAADGQASGTDINDQIDDAVLGLLGLEGLSAEEVTEP